MKRFFPTWLSLQQGTLAILVCLGISLAVGTGMVLKGQLLPVLERSANDLAKSRVARVQQAIDGHLDALKLINREYSQWDAMHEFVLAPETMPNFVEEELYEEYWTAWGIELALILDAKGQLVWGVLTGAGGGGTLTLDDVVLTLFSDNPFLSSHASVNSHSRGLINTPVGLMMVVSAPITRDDRSGRVAGSFLLGSILDKVRIADISASADASVAMFFLSDPMLSGRVREVPLELEALGADFLKGKSGDQPFTLSLLRDLYGDPAAVVEISTGKRIGPSVDESINAALKLLSLGIAAFVLVCWLLLRANSTS